MRKIYLLMTVILCGAFSAQLQATGTNLIPQGTFDSFATIEEVFTVFTLKNGSVDDAELLVSDNTLDASSTKMLKLLTPTTENQNAWDLQFATPEITLVEGTDYKFSFDIRSEGAGLFRISTSAVDQFGTQYRPNVETSSDWKTVTYTSTAGPAGVVEFNFDMGTIAEMVYYIDNVKLIDLSEAPEPENLIEEGSFESFATIEALLTEFTLKNGNPAEAELLTSDNVLDLSSTKMLKLVTPTTASNAWDLQFATPVIPLIEGNEYKLSFEVRSEGTGLLRISTSATEQLAGQYWEDVATSTDWTTVVIMDVYGEPLVAGTAGEVQLNFDMGTIADMIYYIDNIKLVDLTGGGTVSIGKPVLEKVANIYSNNGILTIADVYGKAVKVYSISGSQVYSAFSASNDVNLPLNKGVYIVVVNNTATKVIVK